MRAALSFLLCLCLAGCGLGDRSELMCSGAACGAWDGGDGGTHDGGDGGDGASADGCPELPATWPASFDIARLTTTEDPPSVALSDDSHVAVTWTSPTGTANRKEIYLRRATADASWTSDEVMLISSTLDVLEPIVLFGANNKTIVVYKSNAVAGSSINSCTVTWEQSTCTSDRVLAEEDSVRFRNPSAASSAESDNWVVTWQREDASIGGLFVHSDDSSFPLEFSGLGSGLHVQPTAAITTLDSVGPDQAVVAWLRYNNGELSLMVERFGPQGTSQCDPGSAILASGLGGIPTALPRPSIGLDISGQIAIAVDLGEALPGRRDVELFFSTSDTSCSLDVPLEVSQRTDLDNSFPVLARTAGRISVAWMQSDSYLQTGGKIMGRLFDWGASHPQDGVDLAPDLDSAILLYPAIAINPASNWIAVWATDSGQLLGQRFRFAGSECRDVPIGKAAFW